MSKRAGFTRIGVACGTFVVWALLGAASCGADTGLPMIAPSLFYMVILLPIIIAIEAFIFSRVTGVAFRPSAGATGLANVISTIIGIPITWVLLVCVDIYCDGGRVHGLTTIPQKLYAVTAQSPWLIPYEADLDWMVPAAMFFLLIPYFWSSVLIERWIVVWKVQLYLLDKKQVRRAVFRGNLASYGLLAGLLILQFAVAWHYVDPESPLRNGFPYR